MSPHSSVTVHWIFYFAQCISSCLLATAVLMLPNIWLCKEVLPVSHAYNSFGLKINTASLLWVYLTRNQLWKCTRTSFLQWIPLQILKVLPPTAFLFIDAEVTSQMFIDSVAFGRPCSSVWNWGGINLSMKLKTYEAVILSSLPYGSETWAIYQESKKAQSPSAYLLCGEFSTSNGRVKSPMPKSYSQHNGKRCYPFETPISVI